MAPRATASQASSTEWQEAPRAGKAALLPADSVRSTGRGGGWPGPQGPSRPHEGVEDAGHPGLLTQGHHLGGQGLALVLRQVLFPEDQGGGGGCGGDGRHPVQEGAPAGQVRSVVRGRSNIEVIVQDGLQALPVHVVVHLGSLAVGDLELLVLLGARIVGCISPWSPMPVETPAETLVAAIFTMPSRNRALSREETVIPAKGRKRR